MSLIRDLLAAAPSPDATYHMSLSMASRRQSWKAKDRATIQLLQNMAQWAAAPSSSLHIVKAGVRAETKTKDLAAVVISLLLTIKHKTI